MTSCESRHFFRPWNNDIDSNSDCGSSTTSSSPVSSSSSSGGSNNNDSMFCEDSSRESCANSLTTLKNFVDSATDSKKNDKVDKSDCPTAAAAAAAAAWYYHHPYYPTDYPDPHWVQEYQSMQLAVSEISRQEALAKQAKKLRPKKFKCDYCPMTFSNNGQLQGHLRIHTGERPFKCLHEGCGKTFTRNEELTRHKRIHTGLRPYACSLCRKKFGRKDHLKKHSKTHENRTLYHPLTSAAFMPFSFPPAQGLTPFFYI